MGVLIQKCSSWNFKKKILVKMVDTKGFEKLSVPVLSVATPTKQKDAWSTLHAPAKPSTHQRITKVFR